MLKITLKAARVNAGLTQKQAAKECRVSLQSLNKWEKGWAKPDYATICLLSSIYNVPIENLILPCDSNKVEKE